MEGERKTRQEVRQRGNAAGRVPRPAVSCHLLPVARALSDLKSFQAHGLLQGSENAEHLMEDSGGVSSASFQVSETWLVRFDIMQRQCLLEW